MKAWAIASVIALSASAVSGQTWQSRAYDSSALYYGSAFAPMGSMSVRCTAPSPQGVSMMETGDFESNRTDTPFTMIVTFSHELIDPFTTPPDQTGFRVLLDGVAYPLPFVQYSDFTGEWTGGPFAMNDAMFAAMAGASEMGVDTGLGTAFAYPVDGLEPALSTAMSFCISGWAQQGESVPQTLARWQGEAPAATPAATAPEGPEVPQFILDEIALTCDGGGTFDPETGLAVADFDGDSRPDYVFNGYGVTCNQGMNFFCGASNCSVSIHLSSQDYANAAGYLGLDITLGTAADGRTGVEFFCEGGFGLCVWNGAGFEVTSAAQ